MGSQMTEGISSEYAGGIIFVNQSACYNSIEKQIQMISKGDVEVQQCIQFGKQLMQAVAIRVTIVLK